MRLFGFCVIVFIMLFLAIPVSAQSYDAEVVDRAVDGIVSVANIVVSDTFAPMTHYRGGDWTATVVGAYINVERLYDDPEIKGDDLSGRGWGIGGGYELSTSFMCYAICSCMVFNGDITGTAYDGLPGVSYVMNAKYSLQSLFTGVGFDLLGGNERWSMPVYAGFGVQRYEIYIDFPFSYVSTLPPVSYRHDADVSGNGYLFGFTLAAAFSGRVWRLQITPYLLYYRTLNKPALEALVHQSAPFVNDYTHEVETRSVSVLSPGLQISGIITPGLSVNLSVGGYIASKLGLFDNEMSHGLKANAVALGITYRGGINW